MSPKIYEQNQNGFHLSTDPARLDVGLIHQYLSEESYWARGVPRAVVERSIQNALCFGVYGAEGQVGFARVITDFATFAYLADVFILEKNRGQGLSKWLVETIVAHPALQGLRRWMLATRDAHGLYEKFGFTLVPNPEILMQRHDPGIYQR